MVTPRQAGIALLAVLSVAVVPLSTVGSYAVRLGTAVLAILLLLRIGEAPGRVSRALLAGALGVGTLSGLMAIAYYGAHGVASPPGGVADYLYLCYGPLAIAGMLALPRHPTEGRWRLKALVEASIGVTSLGFCLEPLLEKMAGTAGQSVNAKVAAIGYPTNAVLVVAVALTVLPRLQDELRPFLRTAGAGLACLMLGDIGYAYAVLTGDYTPTSWPAAVTQAGLVLVALAPTQARTPVTLVEQQPRAPSQLESSGPYLATVPGISMSTWLVLNGKPWTQPQMALALVIGSLLIVRQLLSNAEHLHTVRRITEREREAKAAALLDPLTQLANRTALHERLTTLLAEESEITLALLDLDDFKDINDTHGHETGDAVLQEIADRLRSAVPAGSLVARLGGDEFAVITSGTLSDEMADGLVAAFAAPVALGTRSYSITASIGVVLADADAATPALAMSHVDVAMYEAKARKDPQRSGVVVLDGHARTQAAARVQLRDDVSHPRLSEFRIVYEPLVDLVSGRIVGAEALMRWQHPVLGEVSPARFIPLAEQVGAIHELGELALRTAVSDLSAWLRAGADACVGVNLSPRQLGSPGLVELVDSVLAEHDVDPDRLVLEITEEALLDDWDTAVDVVHELTELGVRVAVDDFGTGYSSLRYLRRFETSTVKIDREFVQAVEDEPRTRALVASVLSMAQTLDLVTVAEGIETLDQLQLLRTLGCRLAQGHLFDRPMEADAFSGLLLSGHAYPVGPVPLPAPRSGDELSPRRTG